MTLELKKRIITSIILITIALIWISINKIFFIFLTFVIGIICSIEWIKVNIKFRTQDILQSTSLLYLDVIVSNPPYVLELEKQKMKANVLQYEPHLALFTTDKEPLLFYKKIGNLAAKSLNCGGKLYFEINEQYGAEILEMLSKIGFVDIALKKDINDKDRMIKAIWK